MTLSWLINRIKLMSTSEIGYRIKQQLIQIVEQIRVKRGYEPEPPGSVSFYPCMLQNEYLQRMPYLKQHCMTRLLQSGKLSFFEYQDLDVGWPINWHRDPLTQTLAPRHAYGKKIDYRNEQLVGDIKVLWELGRQQFLVPVAIQYFQTGDRQCLEVIAGVLNGWVEENPFALGVHWCSSLEVGIRGISWSICHQILLASGLKLGVFQIVKSGQQLKKQIFQHALFIRGYLSRYSSANNHLIGELTGLHVLCSVFDMGPQGQEWHRYAWSEIEAESSRQIYTDGVNKEQALYYHCWVLEYLLINALLKSHLDQHISADYMHTLSKMAQFIKDVTPGKGVPPMIGDADDGVAIMFDDVGDKSFYGELLSSVGILAGQHNSSVTPKAIFYKALSSPTRRLPIKAPIETTYPVEYPEGGYAVLGTKNFHVVFDCGPLGYPSIAAHGHADMLNICLALDGDWWLVDPGTYSYHSQPEWRNYFRSSLAHNTVVVNGKNQSEIGGPFMWTRHASSNFEGVSHQQGLHTVSGSHDGYKALGVPVIRRSVEIVPDSEELVLKDTIKAHQKVVVSLQFHFAPGIEFVEVGQNSYSLSRHGARRGLILTLDPALSVQCCHGNQDLLLGWYSSALGKKEPCLTFQAKVSINCPSTLISKFSVMNG